MKLRILSIVTLATLVAPFLGPTAVATKHDPCLHLVGAAGQVDAGDFWPWGNGIFRPISCEGEMDLTDPNDWFFIPVPLTQSTSSIVVTTCPTFVTINPWNTDLNLYFLPASAPLPMLGVPPLILVTVTGLGIALPAGIPMGSSAQPGCETLAATMDAGANDGRWYINVHRTGGQGGYHLTVA